MAKLGTAGAISKAVKENRIYFEDFLVINGDTILNIDVSDFINFHKEKDSSLTVALTKVENASRFGKVELDKNNKILTIERGCSESGYINAGWYLMNASHIPFYLHKGSVEMEIFPYIDEKYGYIVNDLFIDIGIPEDLEKARAIWT
jgi:D-glycero-alpha-D-manno-heptose 1-phosphate guanylyltransferase